MHLGNFSKAWWGPPKKFKTTPKERHVSWLELFFDLVYVIAVSRITHHFSQNISTHGLFEFATLFTLIYWGWLNGSLHHDLHGNQGLRTRLITLWQMMIIAAMAIVIDRPGLHHHGTTAVMMIMQLFITYLWWSVGFYDKDHRRYSWPCTTLYLLSFALMGLSLFISEDWLYLLIPLIFLCNYAPPFITHQILKMDSRRLDLSGTMFERLGLFTIILFGELTLATSLLPFPRSSTHPAPGISSTFSAISSRCS